jgi:hypothetical protein
VNQDRREYDAEAFASKVRPQLLNQYQTSDQFKFFRENRIAVSFSYYDKNGQSIANIIASAKEASNHTSESSFRGSRVAGSRPLIQGTAEPEAEGTRRPAGHDRHFLNRQSAT